MNKTSLKKEILDGFEINYKKHPFSKSIKITLKQEKVVLVTMPYFCPYYKAKEFLISNFDKIKSFKINTNKIPKDFKTKFDTLRFVVSSEIKVEVKNNIVYFNYPDNIDFNSEIIQKPLKEAYFKAIKIEAKFYLADRLSYLAKKYDFKYGKVTLRNQKTRFGSCSYCNNINLNINLMNYGFDEIDYVLIHELCHTRVKNHSENFWHEVEKYCPNYKVLRKNLKNNIIF